MADVDADEIQQILDSLDVQLAAGKIDLKTYRKLTAKWQAKLAKGATGAASEEKRSARAAPAVEAVVCPECSAPLEDLSAAAGDIVRCSFCRATFTLKRAQEESERAGLELRRWLDQMVSEAVGNGVVDTASRRFIFGEKLYPSLQLEHRRAMEPYQDVQEHPLAYVDLLAPLAGYGIREHVLLRNPGAIPRVRALSLKVNSPLIISFAVAEEDRRRLQQMDFEAGTLVYIANVASLYAQPGPEAYSAAKDNLAALQKQCDEYLATLDDPQYAQYLRAVRMRLGANMRTLDVLATIFAPEADFAPQVFVEELDAARRELAEARALCDSSTCSALTLIPLRTGLQRDEQAVQLVLTLLNAYRVAARSRPLAFPTFYQDLKALLSTTVPRPAAVEEMAAAVEQATTILQAGRGEPVLRLVNDWSWCEGQVEQGRKRALLGGGETVGEQLRYWHPFWYATVRYTVAKGKIVVSGVEHSAYGLMDATDGYAQPQVVTDQAPLYPQLTRSLSRQQPTEGRQALPSLIPAGVAARAIAQAAQALPNCRNVQVAIAGLVYLPAVIVHYLGKSGERVALYCLGASASPVAARLLSVVRPFFERYA